MNFDQYSFLTLLAKECIFKIMAMDYKKWTMIIIAVAVAAIVVVSMVTTKSGKTVSNTEDVPQAAAPSSPLVDQDFQKVVPVEQRSVD